MGDSPPKAVGQPRTPDGSLGALEIERRSAIRSTGPTLAAEDRSRPLSGGRHRELSAASPERETAWSRGNRWLARRVPKSCVLQCLPICLPSLAFSTGRRRTPADRHRAQLSPAPDAGRQWHGSGQAADPSRTLATPRRTQSARGRTMLASRIERESSGPSEREAASSRWSLRHAGPLPERLSSLRTFIETNQGRDRLD